MKILWLDLVSNNVRKLCSSLEEFMNDVINNQMLLSRHYSVGLSPTSLGHLMKFNPFVKRNNNQISTIRIRTKMLYPKNCWRAYLQDRCIRSLGICLRYLFISFVEQVCENFQNSRLALLNLAFTCSGFEELPKFLLIFYA